LTALKFDSKGLITAIAQDHLTGEVRMVAWMNQEALDRTLETGRATFYSRSRQALWEKGETSGNHLKVRSIRVDCDGDTLLLAVQPQGPSCHTGARNCFVETLNRPDGVEPRTFVPFLLELERVIADREASSAGKSYTKSLLEGGARRIGEKITEEAAELDQALNAESDDRVVSEVADLLFHTLVGLRQRRLSLRSVIKVLDGRMGVSGHQEKASRGR
jgi:phosphoribosyl-ATP pyrophosphohydrolase/phosphoribosyl-AMP cyclohydrolase